VISGTAVQRAPSVPVVRPGVETEEERVRARQQHAVYRRLFMDIEREQVKENIRQRNHRLRMAAYVVLYLLSHEPSNMFFLVFSSWCVQDVYVEQIQVFLLNKIVIKYKLSFNVACHVLSTVS